MNRDWRCSKIAGVRQYLEYIRENPAEIQRLYSGIRIHVRASYARPTVRSVRPNVFPS